MSRLFIQGLSVVKYLCGTFAFKYSLVKPDEDEDYYHYQHPRPGDKVTLALQCSDERQDTIDFVNTDVNHTSVGVVIEEVGKEYSGQVS